MAEFPNWMISVDDHVLEPGHLWQERVPAKLRDRAPRLIDTDEPGSMEKKKREGYF